MRIGAAASKAAAPGASPAITDTHSPWSRLYSSHSQRPLPPVRGGKTWLTTRIFMDTPGLRPIQSWEDPLSEDIHRTPCRNGAFLAEHRSNCGHARDLRLPLPGAARTVPASIVHVGASHFFVPVRLSRTVARNGASALGITALLLGHDSA